MIKGDCIDHHELPKIILVWVIVAMPSNHIKWWMILQWLHHNDIIGELPIPTCVAVNSLPWYLLTAVNPVVTSCCSNFATGARKSLGLARPLAPTIREQSVCIYNHYQCFLTIVYTYGAKIWQVKVIVKYLQDVASGWTGYLDTEPHPLLQWYKDHVINLLHHITSPQIQIVSLMM